MGVKNTKITDYIPDNENFNLGTVRGLGMIEDSLQMLGAARSIVVDANNNILAGNHTQEAAVNIGLENAIEIETDGTQLVVVKRKDIDIEKDPERAIQLKVADNRSGQVNLNFDYSAIMEASQDVDLGKFFKDSEIDPKLLAEIDLEHHWKDMPEMDNQKIGYFMTVQLHIKTEQDMKDLAALLGQDITPKTKFINFPYEPFRKRGAVD
jgi:hypothetical protein